MKRREFLGLATVAASTHLLVGCTNTATSFDFSTGKLETTQVSLALPPQLSQFAGLKFAFVSDIHNGWAMDSAWLDRAVAVINEQLVDFVFLGGDYIWMPDSKIPSELFPKRNHAFDGLKEASLAEAIYDHLFTAFRDIRSRYGIYGVFGNHDRWIYPRICQQGFDTKLGKLLVNELTEVPLPGRGVVEIYGADDYWNGLPEVPSFSNKTDRLKVFLTHNPDHAVEDCASSLPDNTLVLCGHTHGGQIRLPGLGALMYNIRSSEYSYGLNRCKGFQIYTSRGIGVVELPYRLNCPQEIVFIELS